MPHFVSLQLCGVCTTGNCFNRLEAIAEYAQKMDDHGMMPDSMPNSGDMPHNMTGEGMRGGAGPNGTKDDRESSEKDEPYMMKDMHYAPAHYDPHRMEWTFYLGGEQMPREPDDSDDPKPGGKSESKSRSKESYGSDSDSKSCGRPDKHDGPPRWVTHLQNRHLEYSPASYYGYIPEAHDRRTGRDMPDDTCPKMTEFDRWWISLTKPPRQPGGGRERVRGAGGQNNGTREEPKDDWDFEHLRCPQNTHEPKPYPMDNKGVADDYDKRGDQRGMCHVPYWFDVIPPTPTFSLQPSAEDFAIQYHVRTSVDPLKPTPTYSPPPTPPTSTPREMEDIFVLTPLRGWQHVYFDRPNYPYPEPTVPPKPYKTDYPGPYTTSFPGQYPTGHPNTTGDPRPYATDDHGPYPTDDPKSYTTDSHRPYTTDDPKPYPTDDPKPYTTGYPEPYTTDYPEPYTTDYPKPYTTGYPEPDKTESSESSGSGSGGKPGGGRPWDDQCVLTIRKRDICR